MKKVETGNDGKGTVSSLGSGLVAKSQDSQQLDLSELRSLLWIFDNCAIARACCRV